MYIYLQALEQNNFTDDCSACFWPIAVVSFLFMLSLSNPGFLSTQTDENELEESGRGRPRRSNSWGSTDHLKEVRHHQCHCEESFGSTKLIQICFLIEFHVCISVGYDSNKLGKENLHENFCVHVFSLHFT